VQLILKIEDLHFIRLQLNSYLTMLFIKIKNIINNFET
jgi:hypothetical protein